MNVNKAIVCGNLTRDPEARTLPSGDPVSNFGVATNRFWTNKEGNKQEQTEFHNIVAFGKLAEICNQYLNKGKLVYIEGRLQTRNWEDQAGVKKYRTEIIAENMQMGPRTGGEQANSASVPAKTEKPVSAPQKEASAGEVKIEDIPF